MDTRYSWSRKIITAIEHDCQFLIMECNKQRWPEAKTALQQIIDEQLQGYKRKGMDVRKNQDRAKHMEDAARLEHFPSIEITRAAVHQAMVHLASIANVTADGVDVQLKRAATTAMVGIIHYNGFAGRSGEWENMKRAHVEEQLKAGANHLVCHAHKTFDTYGALAKHIFPGTQQAMGVYVGLPGKRSDLFLEPPKQESHKVSISQHLKRFGAVYFPECMAPNSNLIRKQFHTQLLRTSRENQCMELMKKVDAHSAEVAKKVYCTTTAADDAKLGQMLYEQIFGESVPWPSHEELEAQKLSNAQLMQLHKGGEVGLDADEDCEGDSEHEDDAPEDVEVEEQGPIAVPGDGIMYGDDTPLSALKKSAVEPSMPKSSPSSGGAVSNASSSSGKKRDANEAGGAPDARDTTQENVDNLFSGKQVANTGDLPSKRGRVHRLLTDGQKKYIVDECAAFCGSLAVPPTCFFPDLKAKGVAAGVLFEENSAEGMRSFMRKQVSSG
jgi:hypothetical protein